MGDGDFAHLMAGIFIRYKKISFDVITAYPECQSTRVTKMPRLSPRIVEKVEVSDKYDIFHYKIQCLPDIIFSPFIIE
jgi:hypothetical protein